MRALLDLMRDNEATTQERARHCTEVLQHASEHLTILDPDVGDEELINAVAVELTRLDALSPFESENERESESESDGESESENESESESESENESESESDGERGLRSGTVSPCESDA